MIDELLYTHFEQQFDVLLSQVPNSEAAVAAFEGIPMLSVRGSLQQKIDNDNNNYIPGLAQSKSVWKHLTKRN